MSPNHQLLGFSVIGPLVLASLLCLACSTSRAGSTPTPENERLLLAFPGAEGFGACTPGGRGGKVIPVTTLEDYRPGVDEPIPGSFRAALDAEGPRIIVFRVAGNIDLKAQVFIRQPYLTVAGQTAPGGGICIRNDRVWVATHDVIIRHLRFRSGDANRNAWGNLYLGGSAENVIVDHCSISWAIFINSVVYADTKNITIQWCIISEGLSKSFHPKGEHSKGTILACSGGFSHHHNLYAHNSARNPRVNLANLDFRNNVVYNWGYRCGYTREGPTYINYINNYFKAGPSTRRGIRRETIFDPGDDMARLYLSGNVLEGDPARTADNRLFVSHQKGWDREEFLNRVLVDEPFPAVPTRTDSAQEAFERVLAEAGATLPKRDAVDQRVVEEARTGTGRIIDTPGEVGGYPVLGPADPPLDTDMDGMSDEWERQFGLDPCDPSDGNADADGDGYTNIEEFLNGTGPLQGEADCTVDAAEFRDWQRRAEDIVAAGSEKWDRRLEQNEDKRVRRKQELIDSLSVSVSSTPGPNVKKINVDLSGVDLEMVLIPAGSFMMGSPESEGGEPRERPQHKVNISRPFYMAVVPTTQAQFRPVLGEDARRPRRDDQPAKDTTWYEAMDFCEILSAVTGYKFRLPTEAEWEYACRAGTTTPFYTGDTITTDQANFNGAETTRFNPVGVNRGKVIPVTKFPPNPWGLYDMHGNEAEYCLDGAYRTYTSEEVTDPIGPETLRSKSMRGGKHSSKAFYCRSAYRFAYGPDIGYGFRVIMEMPVKEAVHSPEP